MGQTSAMWRRVLDRFWFGPAGFLSWLDAVDGSDLFADDA